MSGSRVRPKFFDSATGEAAIEIALFLILIMAKCNLAALASKFQSKNH
jgi:hypothetical protein